MSPSVANPNPIPLDQFKVGNIYCAMNDEIVQITAVGQEKLPHCMAFKPIGWVRLYGRWWDPLRLEKPEGRSQWELDGNRYDRIYFTYWDGRGVLFHTPQWEQLKIMIEEYISWQPTLGIREADKDLAWRRRKMAEWDGQTSQFFRQIASTDPAFQPTQPPVVETKPIGLVQSTSPWDHL